MAADESTEMRIGPGTAAAAPAALATLELRVEGAVAIARASEAAIMTVGAAAFDAAEQARRAAELAERASASMLAGRPGRVGAGGPPVDLSLLPPEPAAGEIRVSASRPGFEDERLRSFHLRADRLSSRLRALA